MRPSCDSLRGRWPVWLALAATAFTLAGCGSLIPPATPDPTRYYVLTSPVPAATDATQPAGKLQIGIRNVEVPAYLRTSRNLVVREGVNEVRYQEYARWAEPLDLGIARVLKERLASSPSVSGVQTWALRSGVEPEYEIVIRVLECEGSTEAAAKKVARVSAAYEIFSSARPGDVLARGQFRSIETPWDGADFGGLAHSIENAVAQLGDELLTQILKLKSASAAPSTTPRANTDR